MPSFWTKNCFHAFHFLSHVFVSLSVPFFSFLLFVISLYVLKFLAICRLTVNFLLFCSLSFFLFQFLSLQNLLIFCFYSYTYVVYLFLLNIDTVCCASPSPSTFSFIFFLLLDKQTNRQTQMQIAWAAYGTNRLPRTVWQNDQSTCMQNYYKVILINRAWAIFLKPHFVLVTKKNLHAACVTSSTCVT